MTNTYSFPTNGLWLQITNISNGTAYANLNGATDFVYEIYSATNLAVAEMTVSNWNIAIEVFPCKNTNTMPFSVGMGEQPNLFLWARDWTGITSNGNTTPDWWFYYWFGIGGLSFLDNDLDSQGNTLSSDFQDHADPNPISFALLFTNDYVNASPANGSISIQAGEPFYEAILVNDANESNAVWQPFTSTNIAVDLGLTNGPYTVLVGLRGLPSNAQQSWAQVKLTLNAIGPALIVTNPICSTVSQPIIQLQGLVSETLSKLRFDVSNASGVFTNQQGYWQASFYDANAQDFTTNVFQCYDVKLTNGLNTITLHATDLAGNTTISSMNFTLDYADASPPDLNILWPQSGTAISGTNFALQAHVDDDTANVTAQITDAYGDTNIVQSLVERSGLVWAQNLPLAAGTNILTVTATNAAGLSTTTNLTLIQSPVLVTMDPLSQLNQPFVSVTGTISDPTYALTVNGVQAYPLDTNGDWKADNVPASAYGTALFDLEVYTPDPTNVGSQIDDVEQPVSVGMKTYEMEYSAQDSGQICYWNYQSGGYDDDGGLDITPVTNGVAYVIGLDGTFDPAWEYADINESSEYYYAQMRVMIEPNDQVPLGQNELYLVSAEAFGCVNGLTEVLGLNNIDGIFNPNDGSLSFVDGGGGVGGTWPMPAQWLQINGQTLTNTYERSDGANVGQALISAPVGGSIDVTPVAAQVSNYWDYTFSVQAMPVTLQIVDNNNNGNILSGQTNTVIVGQQMNLSCQLSVTNAGLMNSMLTNIQWTVPGYAISNYVVAPDTTSAFVATNFATNNLSAVFYWVDGGSNRAVQCSATINGQTVMGNALFTVLRPTAKITPQTASVEVETLNGHSALIFGNFPSLDGIIFSNTITMPTNFNGAIEWVQVDSAPISELDSDSTNFYFREVGQAPYLDTSFPYAQFLSGNPVDIPGSDLTGFTSQYVKLVQSDTMTMTLLFTPTNGIPVPLRSVNWYWSGTATNDPSGTNGWGLENGTNTVNPPDTNTEIYPIWNSNITNRMWSPPL